MTNSPHTRSGNFRGFGRLAVEATLGLTELVEAMHRTISVAPGPLGTPPSGRTKGLTGFVYGNVRGVTRLVGNSVDAALAKLAPVLGEAAPSPGRDSLVAALNGVLGDYLEASGNPLAIPMQLRRNGEPLGPEAGAVAAASAGTPARMLLLMHGLCMNETCWSREGRDLGAALGSDLGLTPVTLRYNTGRHVSTNGRELSGLLESFLASGPAPPPELTIVTHSMGGLVTRSALHYASEAGHSWPRSLRSVVFLGTPHHGAPTERAGNLVQAALGVSPYSLPFARLGKLRSAGITDLRHGNLLDDDWEGHDRFAHRGDARYPLPLPAGIAFFAVAATTTEGPAKAGERLAWDGLVPVESALGHHRDPERTLLFPEGRTWIARGMNHFDLLDRAEVTARLGEWLKPESPEPGSGEEASDRPRGPL
ncbi:MAG: alpha/beta hydrolase [Holophagales bacterium]|nr:alpha/beta hydrolase [Holophagales bacterium]